VTRYVTLAEYYWLAEQVTGIDTDTLAKASLSSLADSALHAPQAGFGSVEFHPDRHDIDQAEEAMLAIAAGGVDETWTAAWLRQRVRFVDPEVFSEQGRS
jgi:death-on-curing protein